jgi:hypothetical protein
MRARIFAVCFMVGAPAMARAHGRHPSEEAQRRELMSELAAAAAEAPQERTDADLMYEAMRQWRGEPRGSAQVAKVLAESKKEHHDRKVAEAKLRTMFFKDPFAEDPNQLIPVRKIDRQLLAAYEVRHDIDRSSRNPDEVSRLRGELAQARADAAAARAEANRLRNQLAKGSDSSEGECMAMSSHTQSRVHGSHPMQSNDRVSSDWAEPVPVRRHRRKPHPVATQTSVAAASPPPAPAETVNATPPAGWHSSDPRGIIVVPIDTPVSIHADSRR